MRISIKSLRKENPSWMWEARRNSSGLGYHYVGTRGPEERVEVRAYGVLCGPGDDDTETQWRVEWRVPGGVRSMTYSSWCIEDSCLQARTAAAEREAAGVEK